MSRHAALRKLLRDGFTTVGSYDPFTARLAENHGYPATYVGSFSFELAGVGAPDMGLMTSTELATLVARIAEITTTPIICDIDTGFGDVNNVWRSVRTLEAAGASGVQIEDQVYPKVCPILPGKAILPLDEAEARVRTAASARIDPDMTIIARSDADIVSVDELIVRSNRYLAAGADAVLPIMLTYEGRPYDQVDPARLAAAYKHLLAEIDGPVMVLDTIPGWTSEQMLELGAKFVLFPTVGLEATFAAFNGLLDAVSRTGRGEAYFEESGLAQDRLALMRAVGVDDYLERAGTPLPR